MELSAEIEALYRSRHNLAMEEAVGSGGFGRVWKARHLGLGIPVAVKVLHNNLMQKPQVRDMFAREARIMARMDHPNVLRVFDCAEGPEGLFLVTEWMELGAVEPPVSSEAELREVAVAVGAGLQALHRVGILHRDIKPDNVLRRGDGRLKLADLGISLDPKQTADQAGLIGTLAYMAPELFHAQRPKYSAATDLYALGVALYELWTGRRPFEGGSPWTLIHVIDQGERPALEELRPGLSGEMRAIIETLMHRDPEARGDSDQLVARLTRAPGAEPDRQVSGVLGAVGPWVLTEVSFESTNWVRHLGHHAKTGVGVMFNTLQPGAPLNHEQILTAAARASEWEHPGLVPVLDWGTRAVGPGASETPYVVIGVAGLPLDHVVDVQGVIGEVEALELTLQLATAVAYLHAEGYVYQMVEPGSVLTAPGVGAVLAWPCYCEPLESPVRKERRVFVVPFLDPALGEATRFTATTDIYGVGTVLCYALTGLTARQLDTCPNRAVEIRRRNPAITAPTATLCAQLLDPDPARRPPSAMALMERLSRQLRRLRGERAPVATAPRAVTTGLAATITSPGLSNRTITDDPRGSAGDG